MVITLPLTTAIAATSTSTTVAAAGSISTAAAVTATNAAAGNTHATPATPAFTAIAAGGGRERSCPSTFFEIREPFRSSCLFLPAHSGGRCESLVRSPRLFTDRHDLSSCNATTAVAAADAVAIAPATIAKPLFARFHGGRATVTASVPLAVSSATSARDGCTATSMYTNPALHISAASPRSPCAPISSLCLDIRGILQYFTNTATTTAIAAAAAVVATFTIAAATTTTTAPTAAVDAAADTDVTPTTAAATSGVEVIVGDGRELRAGEKVERAEGRRWLCPAGDFWGRRADRVGAGALRTSFVAAAAVAATAAASSSIYVCISTSSFSSFDLACLFHVVSFLSAAATAAAAAADGGVCAAWIQIGLRRTVTAGGCCRHC